MRNYQHYTSKGTACNNKGHGCELVEHYIQTLIKVTEQLVVDKDTDVNEHETLQNITLRDKLK